MNGLQEAEELRTAGFDDSEISQWATQERNGLREVGFTDQEITGWFGERPPNTAKANSALARAVSESLGRAGQGVADIATIYGPIEAALHAASGLIAGFPAYLGAGSGTLIARGLGLTDDDPKEIAAKFAEHFTYQPMTQAGQRTAQSLMLPFTLLTEAGEKAGHKVLEKTDSPVAAALTEATVQMLPPPLLVSLGRRMAGKAPTEQTMKDAAAAIAKDQPEAVAPLEAKLRTVYEDTGIDPVVVYDHATKDPKVLENLVADNRDPAQLFAQSAIEPTARMALREELQALEGDRLAAAENPKALAEIDKRVEEIRKELSPRTVSDALPAERPGEQVEMPPKGWGAPSKEALLAEAQAKLGAQPGHFGVEILTPEQHAQMAARMARADAQVRAKDAEIEAYRSELQAKGVEHPEVRPIMEVMAANELGWAQIGGRHLGGPMGTPNFSTWIPRAEWWRERPDKKMNEHATRAAVQKALAGEKLKPIEQRAVDHMLQIAQTRAAELKRLGEQEWNEAAGAAREQGLEPTTQNVVEVDMVARASALDETAVERAALQFENDAAGFLSAIKGIVNERESAKATEGGQEPARTQERPGAATPSPEPGTGGERAPAAAGEPTGPITGLTELTRGEQPAAIGRAIEERLRASGVDEAEAKANGAVWEAFFASAGERYNVDPAVLLERYMVQIKAGELPTEGALRQEAAAPVPIFYSELARQIDALPAERIPAEGLTAREWKRVLIEPASTKRVAIRDAKNKPTGETKDVTSPEHPALPGVKAEEIKWSGIEEWLDVQEGKVTKEQVAEFLKAGGVKVEEVMRGIGEVVRDETGQAIYDGAGGIIRSMPEPKFGQYQLPGGQEYRELLLTLPEREAAALPEGYKVVEGRDTQGRQMWSLVGPGSRAGDALIDLAPNAPREQAVREALSVLQEAGKAPGTPTFRSTHFDEPNVIAHIRFNERTAADGKRTLFIEEIQSDWAQKGKREGFAPSAERERIKAELLEKYGFKVDENTTVTKLEEADIPMELRAQWWEAFMAKGTIPLAPFVGKTESWVALSLKRMLRYAAEEGYDRLAWTTGEQQVTRYQSALRKGVDLIEWTKTPEGVQLVGYKGSLRIVDVAPNIRGAAQAAMRDNEFLGFDTMAEALESVVTHRSDWQSRWQVPDPRDAAAINRYVTAVAEGKSTRTKVVDTTEKETELSDAIGKAMADQIRNDPAQSGVIEGENIRIDDTGMAAFYDRIVPNVANDVLKKLGGGKVVEVEMSIPRTKEGMPLPAVFPSKRGTQQAIEITAALRERATKAMPLFQEGEGAPRGQIEFGERGTIISLLENADRSTFLHETGHFFLQVTRDLASSEGAPALARQDWKVLSDWLALAEGAEIPRAAHEKFAEGFEQYLAEGKAPSPALRSIFEQFRDWLLEIYTIVKDAGLSDDVRGVLDRMLSSQTERPAGPPPAPPAAPPPRPPQSPPPSDPQKAVLERISMDPAIPRRYTWEEFYADVKDDLWPIKNLVDELRQGTALGTAEDPYKLARLTRGAFGRATQFLEYSPFEFKTLANVGKSLKDVLAPVKDDLDGLRAYAVSRRSIELAERDIVTGVPLEEARAVVEQGQKYEAVLKDLQEYQDHVLAYLKDAGVFNEEAIVAMREANKDYVPFYRLMEDAEGQGGAGPGLSVRSPIKRIKGSERKIIDPLESIVKNTYLYTALADRNAVGQALVALAERSGRQELVQKVQQPVRPIEIMDEEMKRFLDAHGIEAPEDTLTVFRRNSLVPEHDQIVVFEDGKRLVYQVPEEVATAFKATDRETAGMLTQILAIPARMLRAGATLSPDFISRNPVRDQFSAYVLSKSGYVPVLDLARGFVSIAKHDVEFQAWLKSGGANSAMLALDRDYVQTSLALAKHTGQLGFYDKTWNIVKNPLEPLRIVSELMENATRVGEFKKALEGMTKEEIQAAGYESREVTLDFARLGAKTRSLNMITAFWNAQLEGMDRVVRAINDRPLPTMTAIATSITLPSVLLWWANHDDPRWQEIPNWQRDLFWIILTDDHIYRIPKPFELGVIFGSSVERILDAFYDDKTDSFKDFSSTMVSTMGLNFMPTIAAPVVGQIVNWNFFTDRPLVSSSMEKLLPEYQYSSYTTQATRALGHIIGAIPGMHDKSSASPMIIDNYIRAWTGTLGVYALQTADLALRKTGVLPDPIRPADTLADMPVLRGFMVRYPSGQAQSIQDFYDSYQKATKVLDTIRHLARQGDVEAALREASIDPDKMVRLKGIHEGLGTAQRTIQLVDRNPNFPAQEKRQLIDTVYYQMIAMAGAGNATLREMKVALDRASKDRTVLDKQFREAGFTEAEIKAYREKTAPNPQALELVQ